MKIKLITFIGIFLLAGCSTMDPVPNDKVQYCDEITSYNDCYNLGRPGPQVSK